MTVYSFWGSKHDVQEELVIMLGLNTKNNYEEMNDRSSDNLNFLPPMFV